MTRQLAAHIRLDLLNGRGSLWRHHSQFDCVVWSIDQILLRAEVSRSVVCTEA